MHIILVSIEQIFNYVSLIISLLSLLVSILVFYLTQKSSSYLEVDRQYQSLLAMAISNPKFRDVKYTKRYKEYKDSDPDFYNSYCAYAYMIWNFIETICDVSKTRKLFSKIDDVWFPTIIEENRLHYSWFVDNERLFRKEFYSFITNKINNVVFTKGDYNDLDLVYPHYVKDFPIEEQKKKNLLVQLLKSGEYQLYFICFPNMKYINAKNLDFIGYVFSRVDENKKCVFIDYIAICENYRNCRYGSIALTRIKEKYPKYALIFEIEKPNNDDFNSIARRRKRFYEKNGALTLNKKYIFPTEDGRGLPMDLMIIPGRDFHYNKDTVVSFVEETIKYIHTDFKDTINDIIDRYKKDFPNELVKEKYELYNYNATQFKNKLDKFIDIDNELEKRDTDRIIKLIEEDKYRLLVIEKIISHEICGFCMFYVGSNKDIFIDYLSIDEKYKKEGLGTRLYNIVASQCRSKNIKGIFFQTYKPISGDDKLKIVLDFVSHFNASRVYVDEYRSPLELVYPNNQYALWFIPFTNETLPASWMQKSVKEAILGMYGNSKENRDIVESYITKIGEFFGKEE